MPKFSWLKPRRACPAFPASNAPLTSDSKNWTLPPALGAPKKKPIPQRARVTWRGLGSIDHSGVRIREAYSHYDAERKFDVPALRIADPKSCQCGEVLKGVIKPWQCKVFGSACKPETPLGALMVSSEGACAAYYQYGDLADRTRVTTNPG